MFERERERQRDRETERQRERVQTKQIEKKCSENIAKSLPTFSEKGRSMQNLKHLCFEILNSNFTYN